jgi:hypothetical protein
MGKREGRRKATGNSEKKEILTATNNEKTLSQIFIENVDRKETHPQTKTDLCCCVHPPHATPHTFVQIVGDAIP